MGMDAASVVNGIRQRRGDLTVIRIERDGKASPGVQVSMPRGTLTDDDRDAIRLHKAEIMGLLMVEEF